MCDFHSICIRADGAIAHTPENSHSGAVLAAGWRENQPHSRPVFIEAEWDGKGEYKGAAAICRVPDGEDLTDKQREVCDRHYKHLSAIMSGTPTTSALTYFDSPEYADVQIEITKARLPKEAGYLFARLNTQIGGDYAAKVRAAINVGADLSLLWPKFAFWLLIDEKAGVARFAGKKSDREATEGVAALYAQWIETGNKPSPEAWGGVRKAAAFAATDAAAAFAATDANAAAAYAAAANAADAAYAAATYTAAANTASAYAARQAHWELMAERFIELLKTTP